MGQLDLAKFAAFGPLQTDIVVLTPERELHIKNRHPQDHIYFVQHGAETIHWPDVVLRDTNNPGTAFMIKKIDTTSLSVVLRLALSTDEDGLMNSIMTSYRIRDRNLRKLAKRHEVLYRRE